MTKPPLTAFLDAPEAAGGDPPDVAQVTARLVAVLATVLDEVGFERASAETSVEAIRLRALHETPLDTSAQVDELTLSEAAAILSLATPFSAAEVRGRIRDDLLVAMSREPIDLRTLAQRYDLGDPAVLRGKIEGEQRLSLREYARLWVTLPSTRG